MSAVLSLSERGAPTALRRLTRRFGPLAAIILLHVAFFYALQSGLLKKAAEALPQEVFVSLVAPAPPAEPTKPAPATAKTPEPKKAAPPLKSARPIPSDAPTPAAPVMPAPAAAAENVMPAAQAAPASPKTVSSVQFIEQPQPEYPAIARRNGEQGTVLLRVLVNEKGRAERAEIKQSSGSSRLDEAARKAALQALYRPHMEDGRPVPFYAQFPINFSN